jgi:diaminohydroxyphosphoribosylaminopyrimidine deaminase / 5-amino-6-(5-phosphoribosylamino)uracil reductase
VTWQGEAGAPEEAAGDARWMRRALELAERGRWTVSPNPLVGCVLVRDGQVVGEGWHVHAGGPHAEAAALDAAGGRARGATAFVSLEPCNHEGRTGPCARALVDAGVTRVVAATADPNPDAAGGADALRAAGVTVEIGLLAEEARRQNEVFFHGLGAGRPFVTVKVAVSLDGRVAAADGTSQWLTGPGARERAHRLRAEADAILVGSGAVLADDPRLTVRLDGYRGRQPVRVVLDRRGRTRAAHRVHDRSAPTLLVVGRACDAGARAAIANSGVAVAEIDDTATDGGLRQLLAVLWDRRVRSVLVEGGGTVAGAFVAEGLVERLVLHVAPVLLGEGGVPAVRGLTVPTLDAAPRWRMQHAEQVDGDAVLTCYPLPTEPGDDSERQGELVSGRGEA